MVRRHKCGCTSIKSVEVKGVDNVTNYIQIDAFEINNAILVDPGEQSGTPVKFGVSFNSNDTGLRLPHLMPNGAFDETQGPANTATEPDPNVG